MDLRGLLHLSALAKDVPELDVRVDVSGVVSDCLGQELHRAVAVSRDQRIQAEMVG